MIARIIAELGPWNWMVLGLLLLTAEVLAPGVFLVWFGIAAMITGAIGLAVWQSAIWSWPIQIVVFLILSAIAVFAGRKWMREREGDTDEPLLNNRAAQLVGRTATLDEAIVNGYGRVRIGDTLWRVAGPDLAVGSRVKVSGYDRDVLKVEDVSA